MIKLLRHNPLSLILKHGLASEQLSSDNLQLTQSKNHEWELMIHLMAETRKSYSFNEEMTGWLSQENRSRPRMKTTDIQTVQQKYCSYSYIFLKVTIYWSNCQEKCHKISSHLILIWWAVMRSLCPGNLVIWWYIEIFSLHCEFLKHRIGFYYFSTDVIICSLTFSNS